MSAPLIQLDLQAGRKLETVCEQYHLSTSRSKRYPNLVQFKYSQLESPFKEQLVRECRGLILDEKDNWAIVARPFDKFFNYGEALAPEIDWSSAKVYEKLDGSLIILYNYDDGWHVATSGSCDAGGNVGDTNLTFKDLFWQIFHDQGLVVPKQIARSYTYMFELMTPFNKVICNYGIRGSVKLIGMRQRHTGHEVDIEQFRNYPIAPSYPLKSIDELIMTFDQMEPLLQEGYVVVDAQRNRIKVKHPGYVALHHMKAHFSIRYMVELVRKAELAEVLAYFPEWADLLMTVQDSVDEFVKKVDASWYAYKDIPIRKDFAIAIAKLPYSSVLFAMMDKKYKEPIEWVRAAQIDTLIHLLGVKPKLEKIMNEMGVKEHQEVA